MIKKLIILLLILFFIFSLPCFGQEDISKAKAWVLYEIGKTKLAQGGDNIGEAVYYFRKALDSKPGFPEAAVGMADAYFIERAFVLAEINYKKALQLEKLFEIPEEKYSVLLKLSSLYEMQKKYKLMEESLIEIIKDQSYFSSPGFKTDFMEVYQNKGLNQLLKLYRMENVNFAVKAHSMLGVQYYRRGLFQKSIEHSLFALNTVVTESVAEIRRFDPDYSFENLGSFLHNAQKRNSIKEYLFSSCFYKTLYYFAAAAYSRGQYPGRAVEIWKLLSSTEYAGVYCEKSKRQLRSPWEEPRIGGSYNDTKNGNN